MQRISSGTEVPDLFGGGKAGFSDGDPASGRSVTYLNAAWFNGVQEEMARFIEWAGLPLDANSHDQLRQAVEVFISALAAPASHVGAGGDAHALVSAAAHGFMSKTDKAKLDALTFSGDANHAVLPGGTILQWGVVTGLPSQLRSFPVAFPAACYGMIANAMPDTSGSDILANYCVVDGLTATQYRVRLFRPYSASAPYATEATSTQTFYWLAFGH